MRTTELSQCCSHLSNELVIELKNDPNQRGRIIDVLLACYRRQHDDIVLRRFVEKGTDVLFRLAQTY